MKKLKCTGIKRVEDITSQCKYEDENWKDGIEWLLVPCCQEKGAAKLKAKLLKFKKEFPDKSESEILKALCRCCNELKPNERTYEKFNKCVREKLNP